MKKRFYLGFICLCVLFALGLAGCNGDSNSDDESNSSTPIIEEYTVTWIVDGTSSTETYKQGDVPVFKFGTEKEADETYTYTFKGWDKELEAVSQDVTYEAVYESTYIDYIYTWVIEGQEIVEKYHYGDVPSYKGETPSKDATAQYSYTFKEWDQELTPVTQNKTVTALFDSNVNSYEVTFDVEGVKTTETYLYGEMPSFNGTPSKEADAQYTYMFVGWDKEIVTVTGTETYKAVFEGTLNSYDITWVVGNNETTETYLYGETPSFKGSTDRESAKYTYSFKGWDKEVETVTGSATYVAQYDEKINKFLVNFYSEDGATLLESKEIEYDAIPTFEASTPLKDASLYHTYSFKGWYNKENDLLYEGTLPEVLGAVDYYASFEENARLYDLTVRKFNVDGSLIGTETVQYGYGVYYTIEAPVVEGKVANKDYVKGIMMPEKTIDLYYSEVSVWDTTTVSTAFTNGEGTKENPYLITCAADLAYLRDQVNAGTTYSGVYFKLTKSIDLANTHFSIGISEEKAFAGHFDGNNCSVRGINIKGTTPRMALFHALIGGGSISNLSTYGEVEGGQYSGGIVGRIPVGTIDNCTNYVNVKHSSANGAGGIAGGLAGTSIASNCTNYGTITCVTDANNKTGGILGALEGGTLTNSENHGEVVGQKIAGGIIGNAQKNLAALNNCTNYGKISGTERVGGIVGETGATTKVLTNLVNHGEVVGQKYVGGIIGYSACTLDNCTNNGKISGTHRVGGIIGEIAATTKILTNLVNNGEVFAATERVGGIVGQSACSIDNCVNNGVVSSTNKSSSYVAGIAGVITGGNSIKNSVNNGTLNNNGLYTGGILGCVPGNGNPTIENCTNNGNINSTNNGVGGIVGGSINTSTGLHVSSCSNTGNIHGNNKVGGIIGALVKGSDPVDCSNTGELIADGNSVSEIIGSDER